MDLESTIEQFRDLVTGLQKLVQSKVAHSEIYLVNKLMLRSEVDELRILQSSQEQETAANTEQAQNLMNLNMKLQNTASKAQGKSIELELRRLETAQLAEELKIVTVRYVSVP